MLDVTPHIANPREPLSLEMCSYDEDTYNLQLSIVEYVSPQSLFQKCMRQEPEGIAKLTFEEGRALVQQNLDKKDAVVLDDSDDDEGKNDASVNPQNIYLTCSLVCAVSMSAIRTPVRGKNCKHMQCFDLQNYLQSNATVSGGRWRCVVCEDFVPVEDLMVDGFIAKILERHGKDVSTSRDKVEIYKDGTYKLLHENKLRYQKKRPLSSDASDNSSKRSKLESKSAALSNEIIDISD